MADDLMRPDQPTGDLGLATVSSRLRALRVELERLDDAVDILERPLRVELVRHTVPVRAEIDDLVASVSNRSSGSRSTSRRSDRRRSP